MPRPLYIFDLDGTLALIEHRRHLVERPACPHCGWIKECDHSRDGTRPKFTTDWRAFFAACVDDTPNHPVIATFKALKKAGAEVWIWSGRSDEVRKETEAWLRKYGLLSRAPDCFRAPEAFLMRKAGDHQPDDKLKASWYADMEPPEWARLTATFDDRDRIVSMWRGFGVTCFQVAPGDF